MTQATGNSPKPAPQAIWQCVNSSMATIPTSSVGKPTGSASVNATLPATRAGFPALSLIGPDSAVIAESYYLYSPWVFGGGALGTGVYTLYDEAIFHPRLGNISFPSGNGRKGRHI